MKTQQMIHKEDMSGQEVSPVLQMDMLLSDLQEQIDSIVLEKDKEIQMARIGMLKNYVRGYRDGNRFYKNNPLKHPLENL